MRSLSSELQQQLLTQHQLIFNSEAYLYYLRNKAELCSQLAKVEIIANWLCVSVHVSMARLSSTMNICIATMLTRA